MTFNTEINSKKKAYRTHYIGEVKNNWIIYVVRYLFICSGVIAFYEWVSDVQGHPRSSTLVPIDSAKAISYFIDSTFGHISYLFREMPHKAKNSCFHLFDAATQVKPVRISGWTLSHKN